MPTIGEMYRTEKIEWRDKTLILARPSFASESAYRCWMQDEALDAIRISASGTRSNGRPPISPAEYKVQASAWQQDCAAHAYDWQQPAWNLSMGSRVCRARWFWLIFNQAGPDGKAPIVEAISLEEMDQFLEDKAEQLAVAWERLIADPPKPATKKTDPTPADKTAA